MSKGRTGRLFVLSAPSGSGKTTVLNALLRSERKLIRSISVTTRPPRSRERNGKDYRFVSRKQFESAIKKKAFLEHARILGHRYGTLKQPIQTALRRGTSVLLGVDIQGARKIRKTKFPTTTIFLLPPSLKVLERRLKERATETPQQIRARLKLARKELKEVKRYDYQVVNDRLKEAIQGVRTILAAEQFRT